ncbi:glycosyltransferase family A protein [Salinarimonas sp. NSM]|uniref:glycosyltransferase family A protein n=1 Tax=Salinarimonas sp. NSM TaxID=3458003 RepID=UPI004035CA32
MASPRSFTFGIPLVGRAGTDDFARVEALVGLTLRSLLAQTDPAFGVLVMGQDRPATLPDDPRVRFIEAAWPAHAQDAANNDAGCKRHALGEAALREGDGWLMLVDADDWVPRDLVAAARTAIDPGSLGGVLAQGDMVDFASGRAAPLPFPGAFERPFHALCGSSVVARLRPDDSDPLRRNPLQVLRDHHDWPQAAAARGACVATLPTRGAYVVGTAQNHSERHGPFAGWRADLNDALRRRGLEIDDAFLSRFGLDRAALTAAGGLSSAGTPPAR